MNRFHLIVAASFFPISALASTPIPINSCQSISTLGDYELTGNLSSNGICLSIKAGNVRIDLRGLSVTSSSGKAIASNAANGIGLRNGSVVCGNGTATGACVDLPGRRAVLEDLTVTCNAVSSDEYDGINAGENAIVSRVTVFGAPNWGIRAHRSQIRDSFLRSNGGNIGDARADGQGGIRAGGSIIARNIAWDNFGTGIHAGEMERQGEPSVIEGNNVYGSRRSGIYTTCPRTLVGNASNLNLGDDFGGCLGGGTNHHNFH